VSKIPNHIAIIPNGNRRGSAQRAISLETGYIKGAAQALRVTRWAKKQGVRHVTFFGLSCENMKNRSDFEIDSLMKGAIRFLDVIGLVGHVHAFGHIEEFKDVEKYAPLYERLKRLNGSEHHDRHDFVVHVAANYSGLPEHELKPLFQALKSRGFADVELEPERYLLSGGVPRVDLLIRTGGENRFSGFLPFQLSYAEMYYTATLWPDLTHREFRAALEWFEKQPRNFGK